MSELFSGFRVLNVHRVPGALCLLFHLIFTVTLRGRSFFPRSAQNLGGTVHGETFLGLRFRLSPLESLCVTLGKSNPLCFTNLFIGKIWIIHLLSRLVVRTNEGGRDVFFLTTKVDVIGITFSALFEILSVALIQSCHCFYSYKPHSRFRVHSKCAFCG